MSRLEPRIGDREREGAAWALGEHFAAGRLSQDEYDERAGQAWQARTHSELAPLFGDLPQPHGRPVAGPAGPHAPAAARPPARRPQRRRRGWVPFAAIIALVFLLGLLDEAPFLIVPLVVALVLFVSLRRSRRRHS